MPGHRTIQFQKKVLHHAGRLSSQHLLTEWFAVEFIAIKVAIATALSEGFVGT